MFHRNVHSTHSVHFSNIDDTALRYVNRFTQDELTISELPMAGEYELSRCMVKPIPRNTTKYNRFLDSGIFFKLTLDERYRD